MTVNNVQSIKNETASPGQATGASGDAGFAGVLNGSTKSAAVDLDSIFAAASQKYNVPVSLLKAVARVESNFHPNATSRCGAMGIMQLMPRTAKWLGVTDAYDPEQNIMGGAKYLSRLLNQYDGNTELALAAYNAGPGTVKKYGGVVPPFAQGYVDKVMRNIDGNFTAGSVSVSSLSAGAVTSVSAERILSAAEDGGDADMLSALLMQTAINQMRLLQDMDMEQVDQNALLNFRE